MAHRYVDRVMHATLSTGTGDLVLGQSFTGYQSIAAAGIVPGDTMDVCIEDVAAGVWETTRATLETAETISRGEIYGSSAGGARVDFGAGIKRVYLVYPGDAIETDRDAAVVARDEAAALVEGFDTTVAAAKATALDVIEASVAAIIIDSGLATTAAGEAAVSADAASDAADRAEADGAAASASAALAKAAVDNAAASVANAAIPRETLVELQAVSGATEGQLGVVYGTGDDRGVYRYLSGVWVYESETLPDVAALADAASAEARAVSEQLFSAPDIEGASLVIIDGDGQVAALLSGDGRQLALIPGIFERTTSGDLRIRRHGGGPSLDVEFDRIRFGPLQVSEGEADGILWAVSDEAGNTSLAITETGLVLASGLLPVETDERSDTSFAIVDQAGFAAFVVGRDGRLFAPGLAGGANAFSAADIAQRDARALALSSERSRRYLSGIASLDAMISHIMSYGQSLSNGTQGWPAITTANREPGLLMLGNSVHPTTYQGAWAPFGGAAFNPLVSTVVDYDTGQLLDAAAQSALEIPDGSPGETVLEGALAFLRRAWLDRFAVPSDAGRRFLASSCGVAGKTLEQLSKGATPNLFQRLTTCAAAAKAHADTNTLTYAVPALIFMQGEYNYSSFYAGGTTDRAAYAALQRTLFADFQSDVCEAIGGMTRPPAIFTYQTDATWVRDNVALSIGQAQMDVAESDSNVFMASPTYPIVDRGGHLSPNGYRWLGQQFGKVMERVLLQRQDWRPLSPISIERRGREVLVSHHVPHPPIVWDMPYVTTTATDYASKGYEIMDNLGSAGVASVEIVGDATVRLVAGRDLTGTVRLRYGGQTTGGGGCLRDSDPTIANETYVYAEGTGQIPGDNVPALVGLPYPLHNWCVGFELAAADI